METKKEILERLINYYGQGNKEAFGRHVGVSGAAVGQWLKKGSFPDARIIPLCPLERYGNYYDFLHHWNDALKKIGDVETAPDKVGKRRKLNYIPIEPKLSTYYARHTWATIAAKLGVSREIIAQCLGHTWADVTSIYIAPDVSAQDAAIKKVADFLSAT